MAGTKLTDALVGYKSIALIGMAKNTGKTTVLNRLISEYKAKGVLLALSSIGRDGETTDIVTGTAKPRIYLHSGTVFATARSLLNSCLCSKEYLLSTGINSALGEILIARTLSGGYVQLSGPSTNAGLLTLKAQIERLGDYTLILDGALSRKSLSSPALCSACVLCTGASLSASISHVVEETAFCAELFSLPKVNIALEGRLVVIGVSGAKSYDIETNLDQQALADYIGEDAELVYIEGAVTDGTLRALGTIKMKRRALAVIDASKLLVSKAAYDRFVMLGGEILLRNTAKLAAVCVNPRSPKGFGFNSRELRERMSEAVNVPVFDVMEDV